MLSYIVLHKDIIKNKGCSMTSEVPIGDINFVSSKIQQIIILSQEVSKYDQGFIFLLDLAERLLQGCRERIKQDAQKIDDN